MRNGSDGDHPRHPRFGLGPSAERPMIGVPDSTDEPFALGEIVAALRRPADLGPGVDTAVMDAIRLAPAPLVVVAGTGRLGPVQRRASSSGTALPTSTMPAPLPRAWRWFTRPRAVRVTPLGALAAASIAVAAVFGLRRQTGERDGLASEPPSVTGEFAAIRHGPAASTAAPRARDTVYFTRFMLVAPGAQHVALVGDFNDWDHRATPLVRVAAEGAKHGVWTIDLPLSAGRHAYAFLVDGQRWVADPDPARPREIGDDFGRPSSAVTVGGGAA